MMPRYSLKKLLGKFPYFLSKSSDSNFYKSQSVTNNQFQGLYNDLHNVYRSFHLNKRCLIWKEQSEPYDYIINFVANYPHLKSVDCYKNDSLIYSEQYLEEDDVSSFIYSYDSGEETNSLSGNSNDNEEENLGEESVPIIPEDTFKIIVETYDEYLITKGFPENDELQNNEYDHDESLDEIGALHNIPRKQYIEVDESSFLLTEPPFNNRLTEDDYNYMNRIINYLMLYHTVPLPVAEIWKLYGILPEMENREQYLLKLFDIFLHDYYYDDSVDEQGKYTCPGDRLFVDDWNPKEWEHKDIFYDYSSEYGIYFFVNINTKTPAENQPIQLSFRFLNNLAVEISDDFLVDIYLNGELIVENYDKLVYPYQEYDTEGHPIYNYPEISNLLDTTIQDNILEVIGKRSNGEIIGSEKIIIRVRGCGTADYYVRLEGDDDNPGDSETPFATIEKALETAKKNNIISIGPGEHELSSQAIVRNSCTLLGCVGNEEEAIITSPNGSFFSIPANKELILKDLKLQSEDYEDLLIDYNVYSNKNNQLPLIVSTLPETEEEGILFNPSFTAEDPASVTSEGSGFSSTQSEGIWSFTNAHLTTGWSNQGNWECEFDLKATGLRYIQFKILCLLDGTTIFGGWENCLATNPSGNVSRDNDNCLGLLNGRSIWNNPSTDWVHITIAKTSPTTISVTKSDDTDNNGTVNYTWNELDNIPAFTIGAGNNHGSNWSNNKVMIKNLIVRKISEE